MHRDQETKPKAKQAVLYARVSSKEQEKEGFSIPAQQKLLRSYALESGFTVAHEFVDIETAKQVCRMGFGEMVEFLKQMPTCRVVLVEKTDRLYRWIIEPDPMTAPIITRMFERYASGCYSLKEIARWAHDEGLAFRKSKASVPKATVHQILRNRIYTGDFDWDGKTYAGLHEPLTTRDLWSRVGQVLDGRSARSGRHRKHDFAFSRLMHCGYCGCLLVGEIKKGRYVYYHCTGNRGDCPKPYVREETIATAFGTVLDKIRLDADVLDWMKEALRSSHEDEREFHAAAVARLRETYDRLQSRLEAMYVDKLDGKVSESFYEAKVAAWRGEQDAIQEKLAVHESADRSYLDQGVQLLELAAKARILYEKQPPAEKRRLLVFLCSNSRWTVDGLQVEFRQPFDMIAAAAQVDRTRTAAGSASDDRFANWLPGLNDLRTIRFDVLRPPQNLRTGCLEDSNRGLA